MKTDYHCHILPGLDDGAKTIEESVFLAQKLVEYGFTGVICVAHSSYRYHNTPETVLKAFEKLWDAIDENHINLTLYPTMEYRIIPETWPEVCDNKWWLPWLGDNLLLEFPIRSRAQFGNLDPFDEIKKVLDGYYQPVLAHPERYHYLSMEELAKLHDLGCEFQLNYGSIYGFYDEETRQRSEQIENEGWYSYTGTDLHNKRYTDFYDEIGLKTIEI